MKLPQLSRTDRLLLGILLPLALLGAVVTYLLLPPKKEGSWIRQPSSFFNTGSGTKVAYMVLERLGYRVGRMQRPLSPETLAGIDALMILEPVVGMEKGERKAVGDWVEEGHVLVVAPAVKTMGAPAPGTSFFDAWFDISPPAQRPDDRQGEVPAEVGEELTAGDPLCVGVRNLIGRGDYRFVAGSVLKGPLTGSAMDEIWKDDFGLVAVRVHHGAGRIIALADTHWMTNRAIDKADNSILLANLAHEITGGNRRGSIAFDEIHHGFKIGDDPWGAIIRLMIQEYWGWGLVQAGLVTVLALVTAGARFGQPRDVVQQTRRQHREFAEAAGGTLHAANAADLAYRSLYQHYRHRLCRLVHLAADARAEELARAVEQQGGRAIQSLLAAADEKVHRGGASRIEMFDMAAQLHSVVEVLEHAT